MYKRTKTIQMNGTASLMHNNLTTIDVGKNLNTYAVISRNFVILTIADHDDNSLNQKQIITKISKDGSHATSGANDSCPTLIQAKFVELTNRVALCICTTKGIFMYEADGSNIMFFQTLNTLKPNPTENSVYARGITLINKNTIAVGTSSGTIMLFEVPSKGTNIAYVGQIQEKNLNYGITDLITNHEFTYLCAGDSKGNIGVWSLKTDHPKLEYVLNDCMGFACTSLAIWKNYLVAAYGNGLITVFNLNHGKKIADINAHGKWINSIHMNGNMLASGGDDCYVRIWQLNETNGKFEIKHIQSEYIPDSLVTAVHFSDKNANKLFITCYDNTEIAIYERS